MNDYSTWHLVKCPPNSNIVDSKWVFRIKKNVAGEIDKYKARLVARGFTQIYGVDYYETYSRVARLASFHLLMAIAACNSWALDNFDFNQAFLNSKLGDDKIIYLKQPPRYEMKDHEVWVYRLLKALYGLKQGLKNWYDVLYKSLLELGFTRSDHPRLGQENDIAVSTGIYRGGNYQIQLRLSKAKRNTHGSFSTSPMKLEDISKM